MKREYPEDIFNWTPREFIEYYSAKYGVMTIDEFDDLNMEIISEIFPKEEQGLQKKKGENP